MEETKQPIDQQSTEQCYEFKGKNPMKQKLLQEIQELGFQSQNQKLMDLGFTKVKQNLRLLEKFQGNVDKIVEFQQGKQAKKEEKQQKKEQIDDKFGLDQNDLIRLQSEFSSIPVKKIQNNLRKCQGNVEQCRQILQEKQDKFEQKQQKKNNNNNQSEKHFIDYKKLPNLIRNHEWDIESILKNLLKKEKKKQISEKNNLKYEKLNEEQTKEIKNYLNQDQNSNSFTLKSIVEYVRKGNNLQGFQEYQSRLEKQNQFCLELIKGVYELFYMGFDNFQKNAKLIVKYQGNFQKVQEHLKNEKEIEDKVQFSNDIRIKLLENGIYSEKSIKKEIFQSHSDVDEAINKIKNDIEKKMKIMSVDQKFLNKMKKQKENQEFVDKNDCENELFYKNIPQNINKLIIDGNNLFFIRSDIRNFILKEKQSGKAEKAITQIVRKGIEQLNHIEEVTLIFDKSDYSLKEKGIEVFSAYPEFDTGDDNIVSLVRKQSSNGNVVYVTSDRELIQRIIWEGGSNVMRSKVFLDYFEEVIGSEGIESIINTLKNDNI